MDIQIYESVKYAVLGAEIESSDVYIQVLGCDTCDIVDHSNPVSSLERYSCEIAVARIGVDSPFYRDNLVSELGGEVIGIAACTGMNCDGAV